MTDFEQLIGTLVESDVEFIVVGGLAATVHGSARLTQDVDVVYARSDENIGHGERTSTFYDALVEHTIVVDLFGHKCRCLDLPTLIATKRAAGRPRDLEAIAELEALHEEREEGR